MGNSCLISAALKVYIARIIMFGWTWILGLRHVQICTLHGSKATCWVKMFSTTTVTHSVSVQSFLTTLSLSDIFDHQTLCFDLISAHVSPGLLLSVLQWCVRVCKGITRSTATVLKKTLQSVQQKRATNGCANRGIRFLSDPLVLDIMSPY